jgi:hypothetical protein
MVLTVSFALSLVSRALLPPSRVQRVSVVTHLTPASGRQDHTTSPSAFADAFVLRTESVHRIPHSTFVTIAKRPSQRGGTSHQYSCVYRDVKLISENPKWLVYPQAHRISARQSWIAMYVCVQLTPAETMNRRSTNHRNMAGNR